METTARSVMNRLDHCCKNVLPLLILSLLLQKNASAAIDTSSLAQQLRGAKPVVERIVDRDAIKAMELQGVNSSHEEFWVNPPGHQANSLEDFPFFAHWEGAGCGATVVANDILLTAQHCVEPATDPHSIQQVRLLTNRRGDGGITRAIAHIEVHPDYRSKSQASYDFLLLKLNSTVLLDDNGNPTGAKVVKLNRVRANPSQGDPLYAAGFGALLPTPQQQQGGRPRTNEVLMDVELEALSNTLCRKHYGIRQFKENVMFCVGTQDGSRGTCNGDSGGPILDVNQVQVGLISGGGAECAHPDAAGVAARIDTVVPWIEDQICRLSAMPPSSCKPIYEISHNHRLKDFYLEGSEEDGPPTIDSFPEVFRGLFDLNVTVQHDFSSWQTSWSFAHKDSFSLLYWQPFDHLSKPHAAVSKIFRNLEAGTYTFEISDANKDGICCMWGAGGVTIANPDNGEVLWDFSGEFRGYLRMTLQLDPSGSVVSRMESMEWINPADPAHSKPAVVENQLWKKTTMSKNATQDDEDEEG